MDKINQELIEAKKRLDYLDTLSELSEKEQNEYKFLQDKIHLYFDSPVTDTTEAERYIMQVFWQNAYKNYKDGGYVTNDEYLSDVRFSYECKLLEKIIKENCTNYKKAIDLGCGNGRYSKFFATIFDEVVGVDMSKPRIEQNNKENDQTNLKFEYKNAFDVDMGQFDFVFASDIFTCSPKCDIENMFHKLLGLVSKNGKLVTRESTLEIGYEDYTSKNYVAYYRNAKFYIGGGENDLFNKHFIKSYKNYGYSMYYLYKYFNVYPNMRKMIKENPMLLEDIVEKYVSIFLKSGYFYVYKKG